MDIGVAENDEQREATYRFLNEEITAQHRMLMEEARGLDTKATVVAGFAAAAISFHLANLRQTIWWFALAGYLAALASPLGGSCGGVRGPSSPVTGPGGPITPPACSGCGRWNGIAPSSIREAMNPAAPTRSTGITWARWRKAVPELPSTKA